MSLVVGLDEAGVGPGFGSLWAAAVHLPTQLDGVADSKRLSAKTRQRLRETLLTSALYGLGEVTAHEIDTLGLGEARRLVFDRALDDFATRHPPPDRIVVDGTLFRPWRAVPYECVPRADATNPHVSAASILAKTSRDAQVMAWCDEDASLDTKYHIRSNKGYLSAGHISGIVEHGFTDRHRRTYRIKGVHY